MSKLTCFGREDSHTTSRALWMERSCDDTTHELDNQQLALPKQTAQVKQAALCQRHGREHKLKAGLHVSGPLLT